MGIIGIAAIESRSTWLAASGTGMSRASMVLDAPCASPAGVPIHATAANPININAAATVRPFFMRSP